MAGTFKGTEFKTSDDSRTVQFSEIAKQDAGDAASGDSHKLRRDTASAVHGITPATGELVAVTDSGFQDVRLGDGSTVGGASATKAWVEARPASYVSTSSISISGDVTGVFEVWREFRLYGVNTGIQFGVITSSSYSAVGDITTIGLSTNSGDSLSNESFVIAVGSLPVTGFPFMRNPVFSSKAAAVAYMNAQVVDGKGFFVTSSDGGQFIMHTGGAAGAYSDDGGTACGTRFAPTSGTTDGSVGAERDYDGPLNAAWFETLALASTAAADLGLCVTGASSSTAGLSITSMHLSGDGQATVITSTGSALGGDWSLSDSGITIENIKLVGDDDQGLFLAASVTDTRIRGSHIEQTNASGSGTAFQANAASVKRIFISESYINAGGYGLLFNDNASGGQDALVYGNVIESYKRDAIAQNNPTSTFSNLVIALNILAAEDGDVGGNSGFSVSIAAGQNNIVLGNISKQSRQEAVHLEDGHKNTVVVGNVATECAEEGVWAAVSGAGSGTAEPPVVALNQLEGAAGNTTGGVYLVYDADGTIKGVPVIGNVVRGFQNGIDLGNTRSVVVGNTVKDATIGLKGNGSIQAGTNFVNGAATWASADGNAVFGKIISDGEPTTILAKTGSNVVGNVLKGFTFVGPTLAHTGASSVQSANLFTAGTRMAGRLTVLANGGAGGTAMRSAIIEWDGSTFTETDAITKAVGSLAFNAFDENAGSVRMNIFSVSAVTLTTKVDFDGIYYQE